MPLASCLPTPNWPLRLVPPTQRGVRWLARIACAASGLAADDLRRATSADELDWPTPDLRAHSGADWSDATRMAAVPSGRAVPADGLRPQGAGL